jgi:hypothetical protein
MAEIWRDDALEQHFCELTSLLQSSQSLWHHHAFKHPQMPWESQYPALAKQLRMLSFAQAENLSGDDDRLLEYLADKLPIAALLKSACALEPLVSHLPQSAEPRDIPGRKWQQIHAFSACLPVNNLPMLEWCAGKSHLGRQLAKERSCAVTALEFDEHLIAAGQQLAARDRVIIDFRQIDVMTPRVESMLSRQQNVIALHSCGDLHLQLLRLCARQRTQTITLAPCCYQLVSNESHFLLSQAAIAADLKLQRDDLRTAVHGSMTSPPRVRRQRQQLQAWRLGFDLLQREVRGIDSYLSTPSMPTAILQSTFTDFCQRLAAHHSLQLPPKINYRHCENAGSERLGEVTALDLPRSAFRRALELWLVLDRAVFLRESGYAVAVGVFCERKLTPRNVLIRAERI